MLLKTVSLLAAILPVCACSQRELCVELYSLLLPPMQDVACTLTWGGKLQASGMLKKLAEEVGKTNVSGEIFARSLDDKRLLDQYANKLLNKADEVSASSEGTGEWNFHPVVRALHALWRKARLQPTGATLPTPPMPNPLALALTASQSATALSLPSCTSKMNTAERDRLKRACEKSHSGVVLVSSVLPGLQLLQRVQVEVKEKAWEWRETCAERRVGVRDPRWEVQRVVGRASSALRPLKGVCAG